MMAETAGHRSMSRNVARMVVWAVGLGHQPEDDLGDDGQRALRADDQLGQVVADHVLDASRRRSG